MKYAYSLQEIKEAERRAIAAGVSEETLMERAGSALAEVVRGAMARLGVSDVLFVCGSGNNGGDGFVAARILTESGVDAAVLCPSFALSPAAARAREKFERSGGEVVGRMMRRAYRIAVDCVLGTGISRAPEGETAALIGLVNSTPYVISCDIPSGLKEGGIAYPNAVRADETVCMGGLKQALLLADGADLAGVVHVAEIGLELCGGAEIW